MFKSGVHFPECPEEKLFSKLPNSALLGSPASEAFAFHSSLPVGSLFGPRDVLVTTRATTTTTTQDQTSSPIIDGLSSSHPGVILATNFVDSKQPVLTVLSVGADPENVTFVQGPIRDFAPLQAKLLDLLKSLGTAFSTKFMCFYDDLEIFCAQSSIKGFLVGAFSETCIEDALQFRRHALQKLAQTCDLSGLVLGSVFYRDLLGVSSELGSEHLPVILRWLGMEQKVLGPNSKTALLFKLHFERVRRMPKAQSEARLCMVLLTAAKEMLLPEQFAWILARMQEKQRQFQKEFPFAQPSVFDLFLSKVQASATLKVPIGDCRPLALDGLIEPSLPTFYQIEFHAARHLFTNPVLRHKIALAMASSDANAFYSSHTPMSIDEQLLWRTRALDLARDPSFGNKPIRVAILTDSGSLDCESMPISHNSTSNNNNNIRSYWKRLISPVVLPR